MNSEHHTQGPCVSSALLLSCLLAPAVSGSVEPADAQAAQADIAASPSSANAADAEAQGPDGSARDDDGTDPRAAEVRAAIERGEVLPGMTVEHVLEARGTPARKERIPPDAELWHYPAGEVAFSGGTVTYVSLQAKPSPTPTALPPVATASGESSPTVAAPRMRIGDSYVYESFNPQKPETAIRTRRTVESTDNGIVLKSLLLGKRDASPRRLLFDEEWSLTGTRDAFGDGKTYSPPLQYYDFPLFVGKSWARSTTERRLKSGKTRYHNVNGRVEGWERIDVPAGRFLALKVVLETELFDPDKGTRYASTDTSWYVPEVRRSVKSVVVGDTGRQVIQLLDFRPGG